MEDLNYSKAEAELNKILKEIENENVDVDNLTVKIKRACELLKFCNDKLKNTDEEVKKILDEFSKTTKLENEPKEEANPSSGEGDLPF